MQSHAGQQADMAFCVNISAIIIVFIDQNNIFVW